MTFSSERKIFILFSLSLSLFYEDNHQNYSFLSHNWCGRELHLEVVNDEGCTRTIPNVECIWNVCFAYRILSEFLCYHTWWKLTIVSLHAQHMCSCFCNEKLYNSQFYPFREILALGFDEKFFRTWEYYFLYCAAGFKSCTLGVYQVTD